MKKKLLTFVACMFIGAFAANAQFFTIGPKVGLSSTHTNLKEEAERFKEGGGTYSYHAGLFARISLMGFYIQPEAYFNSVQGEYVEVINGVDQPIELNQNKIDIPVLVGFKVGPLRINAGPVASFNLDSEVPEDFEDTINDYKSGVFAYQAGIGVDISKLTFDLRYEGNISDQATLGDGTEGSLKLHQIMLSVGLKLL